jgi:predicted RNA-binding protein with TRAM domain
MDTSTTQTVTVDRISNSGNAIAQQQHAGKTIHVPTAEVGATVDVRLVDKGGYFEAKLVDRADETQPRQPSTTPDTSDIANDLLTSGEDTSSQQIRSAPAGGDLRTKLENQTGKEVRSRMPQRKK